MSSVVEAPPDPLSVVELATKGPRRLKVSPELAPEVGFMLKVPLTVVVPEAASVYARKVPGSVGLKVRL